MCLHLLIADDQVVTSNNKDILQTASHVFYIKKNKKYNLILSVEKSKIIAFCGAFQKRTKMVIVNRTIEKDSSFHFLGYNISYPGDVDDVWNKRERVNMMNRTELSSVP